VWRVGRDSTGRSVPVWVAAPQGEKARA
jgi:hypothetical protein